MVHAAMTISLTSYRSDALGLKALLFMVRICLLHVLIEMIYLIINNVGRTVHRVTTTTIFIIDNRAAIALDLMGDKVLLPSLGGDGESGSTRPYLRGLHNLQTI